MVRRWFRHRNRRNTVNTATNNKYNVRFFSLETLRIATNNFSTLIGEGGFGQVFKGVLPDDGRSIAVKRLLKPYQPDFLEMVELMSHLQHKNLIQVIGCCIENDEQLLVCEYAEKGSVAHLLHVRRSSCFNWERRASVCIGTARAISYLHNDIDPRVIHCDIKPSNILLDAQFNPKITDFDMIDFVYCNKSPVRGKGMIDSGDANTTVKGTIGYLDPEYYFTGQLTQKVDVYSFGLVILEIITGRKVVDMTSKEEDDRWILNWVKKMRKDGKALEIVDPKLTDFPKEDVERFINVALLCTQAKSELRPSMFEVVYMLHGRPKSDQEISKIATEAIVEQPEEWFSGYSTQTFVSMRSQSISTSGKSDVTEAAVEDAETRSGSCSKGEDFVAAYFERSMEKIMRHQVAVHNASNKNTSEQVSMEVVYPPFLSGEYRRLPLKNAQLW